MHDVDKDLQFDLLNDPRIYAEDQIIKFLNKENVMDLESYENVNSLKSYPFKLLININDIKIWLYCICWRS